MDVNPLYTVGSRLRLPFGSQLDERRYEVTRIDQRASGVWYRFDLLQQPFTAPKWYSQIQLTPHNPVLFAEPVLTVIDPPTPAELRVLNPVVDRPRLDLEAVADEIAVDIEVTSWQYEGLFREERLLKYMRGVVGDIRGVAAAVDVIPVGMVTSATLDDMKARTAKAADKALALCQEHPVTEREMSVIFGACRAAADYATDKEQCKQAYKVSMQAIAGLQISMNRVINHIQAEIQNWWEDAA